ncbi:hypothetical protein [Nonomuraea solani]|uniref:hypothetical protein n=1 Tax=Nonomuraea solani TaxID=1144553 RepID=UPI000CDEFE6D|nr:hypothetical protein [Nonomuraea solani]
MFGFLTKSIAVVVPHVVAATGWQTWLFVAPGCLVLFIPAIVLFNGPWRRAARTPAAVAIGEAES